MSWTDWTGGPVQGPNGVYGTCGSVLCLCPGKDIGLPDNLASGVVGQFMFQYNITVRNPNVGANAPANINYMLYLITVDEGVWTIENGMSIAQGAGIVSQMDVINAREKPGVSYDDVAYAQGSGRFFSNLKSHMRRRMRNMIEKADGVHVGGVNVGGVPVAGVLLGGSLDEKQKKTKEVKKDAGVLLGGKTLTASELKSKLKKYV
jgi:hypothetical protein